MILAIPSHITRRFFYNWDAGHLRVVFFRFVDRDIKPFICCLSVTVFLAILRFIYCYTLPIPFDYDISEFIVQLTGAMILLSFVLVRFGMDRLTVIVRSLSLLILTKLGLLPTVVDVYWSGRWCPLADDLLANLDRMLGFDWMIYVKWITAHPFLLTPLHLAYQSIWWQPMVVGLLLVGLRQIRRVYVMVTVKGVALLATGCVTMFFPAYGAYTYFRGSLTVLPNLGGVDTYRSHMMVAARVMTAR